MPAHLLCTPAALRAPSVHSLLSTPFCSHPLAALSSQENKKLSEPLTRALKEVEKHTSSSHPLSSPFSPPLLSPYPLSPPSSSSHPLSSQVEKLRHELANYQKDKMSLQNAKSRLHVLETQLRDLTWEHEVRLNYIPFN